MQIKIKYFLFLLLVSGIHLGLSQPANDDCGSAIALTVNDACVMDSNNNATATEGLGCWGGSPSNYSESVWYSFVANETSQVIDITGNSLTNFLTSVYSGSCGSWTEIACDNSGASIVVTGLTPTNTYYVMMDGSGTNVGSYCIRILDPPPNDDCSDAVTLTVGAGCVDGFNSGATDEGLSNPSCWNGPTHYDESVWYEFVATDDSITVNFGDGTLGTSAMGAVYSGSCGSLTEVGCAKNGAEIDLTGLTVNDTYYIMVDGNSDNDGTFCISVYETPPPPPPIGTCVNPRDLNIATTCTNVKGLQYDGHNNIISTDVATGGDGGADAAGYTNPEGYESACGGSSATDDAYWIRFEATNTSVTVENGGGDNLDYTLYSGTDCSSLTELDCQTINGGSSSSFTGLTTGTTYMIMITNSSSSSTTQRYACLTGTAYTPPLDNCADAQAITENTIYNLSNAEATQDRSLCSGSMENNIWVYWPCPVDWTGDAYVHLFNQDCACQNGLQMSIYTASSSCPPNNGPTCEIELNPNNNRDFYGQFTPTAGETYYVTIDGYADCACVFDFAITNNATVPTDPAMGLVPFFKFSGENRKNMNLLKWHIQQDEEKKLLEFEIQRSNDGTEFTTLNNMYSDDQPSNQFAYIDIVESSKLYYYRIKEISGKGAITYSKIIKLKSKTAPAPDIYPSILDKQNANLYIALPENEENIKVEIFSSEGTKKLEGNYQNIKNIKLSCASLERGIYIIRISSKNYNSNQKLTVY